MIPRIEILPPSQKLLWPRLANVPKQFILYGGTAIALQLGHRISVDFDFFSSLPLDKADLLKHLTFLEGNPITQPEKDTLECFYRSEKGDVRIQFLAGIGSRQGRVEKPILCEDNGIQMASLRDLMATKLNTIQARAEVKDYIDIDAIIRSGITLGEGLGCAVAVFGAHFDPATSLRALCSYRDGNLDQVPTEIKKHLNEEAILTDKIPSIVPISKVI